MSIAIVTGASSGIGAELARGLVSRGIDEIWLVARRRERLVSLGEELGIKYKCITADLATSEGIESVREALKSENPSVKYLINAAGFGDFGAFALCHSFVLLSLLQALRRTHTPGVEDSEYRCRCAPEDQNLC